ncbi:MULTISPECIES: LacI family DNA-binding transcriptional regulator [unclassified Leifsonia]|uniref:LacI family DNA-binding transcriptional regulator n=1 Tax=unclassified Leifsonia TaxID=2663824 RepID=UPI0006FEAFB7|nr:MULTISPECIES: LacI family DNA-binding transcriptional regulator [unclassified Leifsonia]KQX08137.1 LacI family transcriptional regulator [Leifsonia sp. Root1293]KRA12418.1 LacI family transcriptional regulator [Leifsonia sp. Root60]
MRKPATIRDVARDAGVSVAVVSRVINEGSGPVAAATRARVVEVIEQLGYQPRAAARELQQRGSTTIGLVLADLTNPFFARLADRVVWEARARGIHVVLLTTQEDEHLEAESIETLIGRSVGSVIATPTGGNAAKWRRLIELGVNVVFVDREIEELPEADVVTIRNDQSAEVTTRHLLELGHERIAFISGPLTTSTGRSRVAGFRQAMTDAGLPVDDRLIRAIPFRGDSGGDAVSALLALPDPPTGIIVGNTAQVRSSLRRIKQIGVSVPEDLSVVVFDDNPWTELVSPPLSVIRQPIDMLASHSVDVAVGRLRGAFTEPPRRIEIDAEFVQRSSAAPRISPPASAAAG